MTTLDQQFAMALAVALDVPCDYCAIAEPDAARFDNVRRATTFVGGIAVCDSHVYAATRYRAAQRQREAEGCRMTCCTTEGE